MTFYSGFDPSYTAPPPGTVVTQEQLAAYVPAVQNQPAEGTPFEVWKVQPFTVGAAPFEVVGTSVQFSTVWDQTVFIGWNAQVAAGEAGVTGAPVLYMGFEQNYVDPSYGGHPTMEWYVGYFSPDHTSVGASSQFRPFQATVLRTNNTSHGAQLQLDIGSDGTGVLNILAGGGTTLATFAPTGINFVSAITGNTSFSGLVTVTAAQVLLDTTVGGNAALLLGLDGANQWGVQQFHGAGAKLFIEDNVNGRDHVTFTAGASAAAATTEFSSKLKVDSLPAFVAGDKYVVADASGNLHLSALGPAS